MQFQSKDKPIDSVFYDALLQLDSADVGQWWQLRMIDPCFDPLLKRDPIVLDHILIYGFVDKVNLFFCLA